MQAASVAAVSTTDFRFDHDDDLPGLGGAASRFRHNVSAIGLLKRLEAESRESGALSTEEQLTLARYSGWGDSDVLEHAFPNGAYSWSRPCAELAELLTPDEIKSLLASSLNAHFTGLPIIRAIYAALDHFGLAPKAGDRMLELDSGQSVSLSITARRSFPSARSGRLGRKWATVRQKRPCSFRSTTKAALIRITSSGSAGGRMRRRWRNSTL